jgi:glyoxylase I family protein
MESAMSRPPFSLQQIDHVVLRVRNAAAMQAFYCDVLGCVVERVQATIGLVQLRAGRSLIDLVAIDGKLGRQGGAPPQRGGGHNLDHLCLRVEPFDLARVHAYLVAQRVEVGESGLRYGAEGEGPSIYLCDPEGNTVELKGAPDSALSSEEAPKTPNPG